MKRTLIVIANILVVLLIFIGSYLTWTTIYNKTKEKQELKLKYSVLQEENNMLYDYVENIDTFKTLDDAIEASQNLIDQIQMLYE